MKPASLILAALLQLLPIARIALIGPALAPAGCAWVASWLAGAIALLGSYDAASGASAGVSGLVKYSGSTPVDLPTFQVSEPVGQPFRYRISVSNPSSDFTKNYYNCTPLPPGLTINTNVGAAGYLSGIPVVPGRYAVTLMAGNLNYAIPATAQATITLYLPDSPPAFTVEPQDISIIVGSNATWQTEVTGTPPFHYQWRHDDVELPNANAPSLALRNVQNTNAGRYQLVVTNAFGSVTSAVVRLTVREPLAVELHIAGSVTSQGSFQFNAIGPLQTNYVIWCSPDLASWLPLSTNWVTDGLLRFSDPEFATLNQRFYRVTVGIGP